MSVQEFQCRRCEEIFSVRLCDLEEGEPGCPKCGSVAVEETSGEVDVLDVLRTRGAGSGGG